MTQIWSILTGVWFLRNVMSDIPLGLHCTLWRSEPYKRLNFMIVQCRDFPFKKWNQTIVRFVDGSYEGYPLRLYSVLTWRCCDWYWSNVISCPSSVARVYQLKLLTDSIWTSVPAVSVCGGVCMCTRWVNIFQPNRKSVHQRYFCFRSWAPLVNCLR